MLRLFSDDLSTGRGCLHISQGDNTGIPVLYPAGLQDIVFLKKQQKKGIAMATEQRDQINEIITMNRQIGNTYKVKMKDIPSAFVGIPVPSSTDPEKFLMDVTNTVPEDENRIMEADIADIEYMEKC
ncbi:MAG: hypothetical protein RQ739_10845 [Desulfotignum sp.]|nr:hypothetical protein [Desulfotignum sp.]